MLLAVERPMERFGVFDGQNANTMYRLLNFATVMMETFHFFFIARMVLARLQIRVGGKEHFFFKRFLLFGTHVLPLSSDFAENITLAGLIAHTITHFFKAIWKECRENTQSDYNRNRHSWFVLAVSDGIFPPYPLEDILLVNQFIHFKPPIEVCKSIFG